MSQGGAVMLGALWLGGCVASGPAAPEVVGVYPSAEEIPENVLRFYVTFSQPMREGAFLDHIRLERADTGENLTGVFFDNIHELWSHDRRRITLLVDPGRVKTALQANLAWGRAFEPGGTYRLTVLDSWLSTHGTPLSEAYAHTFTAVAEDVGAVDPSTWCLTLPKAGTSDALQVDFGEAVDHVSVHKWLGVADPAGAPLRGRWALGADERRALWTPAAPWAAPVAGHALVVGGRFEDIAGNNLNAPFEHDVGAIPDGNERSVRRRPFSANCDLPASP